MKVHLDYGREGVDVEVPDGTVVLDMPNTKGLSHLEDKLLEALRCPIGIQSFVALARGRRNACIVISDITRPVPNADILPPMLALLDEAGMSKDDITILVATGLHRPNVGDELMQLVGERIAGDYRIVNHRARDRETLVHLGQTSGSAPIWIDRVYVEADLKIATSLIEPHLMAGFSGGRKAICPGLMGVDTMRVLHGPALLGHPLVSEGYIDGNPFHRQALEVAQRAGVDFTVNVSMNARRQVTGIFCGDLEKAHAEGVRFVEERAAAWIDEPVDIVITCSAGYPLDLTFYQAIKGLTAVLPIVKEGGTILIAARCAEGLGGEEFTQLLLETESVEDFRARLKDPDFFAIDQWQLQELCKVLSKVDVEFFSEGIGREYQERVLVHVVDSLEDALAQAMRRYGPLARVAVVPRGPYVLTRVAGGA